MELTTKTASDVAVEVKRTFGDEDASQISDDDIIKWINAAQRKIASQNPVLQRTVVHDVTAGLNSFSYPADRVQYISAIRFNDIPLENFSYDEAQQYILTNAHGGDTGTTPMIWYSWAQQIKLWPTPSADAPASLSMDFTAIPEDIVAINDPLVLPDRYFDLTVELVLMKARVLDQDWMGVNSSQGFSAEMMAQLSEQENKIRTQYHTITVREQDL